MPYRLITDRYQGITKTYVRLRETYGFPGIHEYIKQVIAEYDIYNRVKNRRYRPYKKL